MKIIDAYIELFDDLDGEKIIKKIEKCGRVCYKSEDKINDQSARTFIRNILKSGHESVIEHEIISLRVICDRGVSHEIVRHRLASYSQESTRYCNYSLDKFNKELTFIKPCYWDEEKNKEEYDIWFSTLATIEKKYNELIKLGASPQEARSILPNSLKTEIVMTMNMREWRHFLKLRTSPNAHPQMREIAIKILNLLNDKIPILFEDIKLECNIN